MSVVHTGGYPHAPSGGGKMLRNNVCFDGVNPKLGPKQA